MTLVAHISARAESIPEPTLSVECVNVPDHPSCAVRVDVVDDRPLALHLITGLGVRTSDDWTDPETGAWGVTWNFSRIPCQHGRPWARFSLEGSVEGECPWDPVLGRFVCPRVSYGEIIFEQFCTYIPLAVRSSQ